MKYSYQIFAFLPAFLFLLISSYQVLAVDTKEIDALFGDYNRPSTPGASVMVIKDGQIVFKKGYGWANIEDKIPTTETTYDIASNTKQFTAMAIMMLQERKKLNYNDPLIKFFPDFPAYGKTITVRNLLTHTSGILDYRDIEPPGRTELVFDNDVFELLKKQDRTYFTPGSKYLYSNSGYVMLALIVEKVSGVSFPEFLKKNIFEPLKMTNTRFYEPEDYSDPHRSVGYSFNGKSFERAKPLNLTPYTIGDGYLYSSVEDLYKWDQALYTTRLVSAKTLKEAFTPAIPADTLNNDYGFGWFITKRGGVTDIWHSGGNFGSSSYIHRLPEKRLTVIVLTNRYNADNLGEITNDLVDLYLADDKTSAVKEKILRLHREYNDALAHGDRKALDRLIAEDFLQTTVVGTRNKSEMPIFSLGNEGVFTEDLLKARLFGDTAIFTGRVTSNYKGELFRVRFTEIWIKRDNGWQIVSSQVTPMPPQ